MCPISVYLRIISRSVSPHHSILTSCLDDICFGCRSTSLLWYTCLLWWRCYCILFYVGFIYRCFTMISAIWSSRLSTNSDRVRKTERRLHHQMRSDAPQQHHWPSQCDIIECTMISFTFTNSPSCYAIYLLFVRTPSFAKHALNRPLSRSTHNLHMCIMYRVRSATFQCFCWNTTSSRSLDIVALVSPVQFWMMICRQTSKLQLQY